MLPVTAELVCPERNDAPPQPIARRNKHTACG